MKVERTGLGERRLPFSRPPSNNGNRSTGPAVNCRDGMAAARSARVHGRRGAGQRQDTVGTGPFAQLRGA